MKDSKEMIAHMLQLPAFKPLQEYRDLLEFEMHFSSNWRNMIQLRYIRNNIIFYGLKHSGFKKEFNYAIPILSNLLETFQQTSGKLLDVKGIKCFISYKQAKEAQKQLNRAIKMQQRRVRQVYCEHSKGEFINQAKIEEIKEIFEDIRKTILTLKN